MKTIEQYKDEIAELQAALPLAQQKRRDHPYMYSGDYEVRCANMRAARKLEANIQSLHNRIKYRVALIYKMENPEEHEELKDVFGQVFAVGQRVAWSSSSRYSGALLGWVVKINPKMISVSSGTTFDPDAYGTNLYPKALIVCDAIVAAQESETALNIRLGL